jgi:hypothetical protein
MGVMLSDAEALNSRKQNSGKANANLKRAQTQRGRGKAQPPVNAQDGSTFGDFVDGAIVTGNGNTDPDPKPEPAPGKNTQSNAPEAKAEELLDLNVMETLTPATKRLLHAPTDSMTRGEVLEKFTNKQRKGTGADELRAQGNLLDTWAAIGDDTEQMGEYLMSADMMKVLNAFSKASRVGGTAEFTDNSSTTNIEADWEVENGIKVSLMDSLALAGNSGKLEEALMKKLDTFFDTVENKVKFATVDGLVDFPKFARADMEIKNDLLAGVRAGTAANLDTVASKGTAYGKLVKPVLKAWQDTATNAIKAIQKLAVDEKAKGKTLFLPELVKANGAALSAALTADVQSTWDSGSTTAGIKGEAKTGGKFMFKLVSVKPGERRAFLKMNELVPPKADISATDLTAKAVVTEDGVKLLKKLSDFYKKAKGKRAAFNPDAWQQKIADFTVAEKKTIDAYNAELAKKASGKEFDKAKNKLETMLTKKVTNANSSVALGGKFAQEVKDDNGGL